MFETSTQGVVTEVVSQPQVQQKAKKPLSYSSLHRVNVKTLIARLQGRFVGVDFVKQDGSVRKLNGRLGVHTYLRGGINTVESDSRPYLTVFDLKKMEYRAVNLATLCSLRSDRHVYTIID